jgi:phytol kinase
MPSSYFLSLADSWSEIWFPLTVIVLFLAATILLAEVLNRLTQLNVEFTRKVVHIGTGNVILLAWWLDVPAWLGIAAAIIASITALISYILPILPSINSVGRKSLGTFFYAVSIGILIGWFWPLAQPQYAATGILVMAWGDGMAALIGQKFGRHPYQIFGNSKSWEGSLTMLAVSFLVTILILLSVFGNHPVIWLTGISVAIMATSLETFSQLGIDNLTVPLGSAALAFVLLHFAF